jgi:hypothetical protein
MIPCLFIHTPGSLDPHLMCVALVVEEVGRVGADGPVEEAVLVHVAALTHHLQAIVVLTANRKHYFRVYIHTFSILTKENAVGC